MTATQEMIQNANLISHAQTKADEYKAVLKVQYDRASAQAEQLVAKVLPVAIMAIAIAILVIQFFQTAVNPKIASAYQSARVTAKQTWYSPKVAESRQQFQIFWNQKQALFMEVAKVQRQRWEEAKANFIANWNN